MPKMIDGFNVTSLTSKTHGYTVHRDYAGHFFRWSVAQRHINPGMRVIDVGCGPEMPLLNVLARFPHPTSIPGSYVGIDLNTFEMPFHTKWAELCSGVSVFSLDPRKIGPADVVVCFEMLEHMEKDRGVQLLEWLRDAVAEDGIVLLSTPSFSGRALPKNHVYEWEYQELMDQLVDTGFTIEKVWGTFMTLPRLKKGIERQHPELMGVHDELLSYYSGEVMSTVFAPLFPELASNCLWKLKIG